jgi:TPR repeat protein
MRVDHSSAPSMSRAAAIAAGLVVSTALGCSQARPETQTGRSEEACIADSMGALHLLSTLPLCASDDWRCRVKCKVGDAASCLAMGYSAEKRSPATPEARRLYHRACLLGAANACTNYAAGTWAGEASDDQLACARRVFEKACAVKEPFACGMVGRIMLESTTPPAYAEGRRYLERACDQVGGFSCRVLATHLESGKLGDYRPEVVRSLLSRACAGGDPDACGEHATAAETFQ